MQIISGRVYSSIHYCRIFDDFLELLPTAMATSACCNVVTGNRTHLVT